MAGYEYDEPEGQTQAEIERGTIYDPVDAVRRQLYASTRTAAHRSAQPTAQRRTQPSVRDMGSAVLSKASGSGSSSGGGGGGNTGGSAGPGSTPPEPQRVESSDLVESAEGETQESYGHEQQQEREQSGSVPEPGQAATPVVAQPAPMAQEPQEVQSQSQSRPEPMAVRHVGDEEIPTEIFGDVVRFTVDGAETSVRRIPEALIPAIRAELCRLGAPELGADPASTPQNRTLSSASLLTALAMSALDLEIEGVDENTRRAAEVLRSGQGRVAAVEMKVEQVLANQRDTEARMRILSERARSAERMLYEMELMLTWLMVDRVEPRLNNSATAMTINLVSKPVIDARARLRDKARDLNNDEITRRGAGRIVE